MQISRCVPPLLLSGGLFASAAAHAIFIDYALAPLGGNQYRYDYTVINDGSLGAGMALEACDILFDLADYLESSLSIVSAPALSIDWDQLLLASGPGVPALFDVFALSGGLAVGDSLNGLSVQFEWIGGAQGPAAQAFEIYDPNSFALVESGLTRDIRAVPEPNILWLLGIGALSLLGSRARQRNPSFG